MTMKKYNLGDVVSFRVEDKIIRGCIVVRDVWDDGAKENVSYDIVADDDDMLYKHVHEEFIFETKDFGKPLINVTELLLDEVEELKKPRWKSGYLRAKFG